MTNAWRLADRIYGCDDCQEVCPPNRREDRAGAANGSVEPTAAWVPILEMLELSDEALLRRFGHWYVPRREPRYLRRNALVVLGNTADPDGIGSRGARLPGALPRRRRPDVAGPRRLGGPSARLGRPARVDDVDQAPEVRDELRSPTATESVGVRHLLVTNDFPPKHGGIQSYLWELWRRLPAADVTVLTSPYRGDKAWDAEQPWPVIRTRQKVLLPTPALRAQINQVARDVDADLVVLDPALPLGVLGRHLERPYGLVLHGAEITVPGRTAGVRSALAHVLRGATTVVAAGGYPGRRGRAGRGPRAADHGRPARRRQRALRSTRRRRREQRPVGISGCRRIRCSW